MSSVPSPPRPEHERSDGSPRAVVLSAAVLAGGIVVVLAAAGWISAHHAGASARAPVAAGSSWTHAAEARTSIARDWAAQDAAVRQHLETYGWNGRAAGVVRIPIDRAIELIGREAETATAGKKSP